MALALKETARIIPAFCARPEKAEVTAREQKRRPDAPRPCGLIVLRAFNALVVQIVLRLPAFFEQDVSEPLHIFHRAAAFSRADIEPDAWVRPHGRRGSKAKNHALIPPHRRRKRRNPSKHLRQLQTQDIRIRVRRAKSRRSPCVPLPRPRGIAAARTAAPHRAETSRNDWRCPPPSLGSARRSVLTQPLLPRVVNPHDDQRLDVAFINKLVGRLPHVPIHPRDERSGAVKQILPIVQIKHRIRPAVLVIVAGRQINDQVAAITQESRGKLLMFIEIRAAHVAMTTRRSLASTCCPGATSSLVTRPAIGA